MKGTAPSQRGLGAELRAAIRPILAYWAMLVVLFGAFSLAAMVTSPDTGTGLALIILGGTTAAAVAVGQLLALLRVRDWLIYVFAALWWTVGFVFSASLAVAAGELAALAALVVFLFPIFLTGGLWSLRTGRALFAAWVPLMYASGAAILVAEAQGKVATWQAGQKWAIWDITTFGVLVSGIVLLLAFLLAREGHRLALWRHGPRAPLEASTQESGAARPRLTLLGWVLLCGLAFGVAVGAAVLAPYLWRTKPAEEGQAGEQPVDPQEDQGQSPEPGEDQARAPSEPDPKKKGRKSRVRRGEGEDSELVEVREQLRPEERGAGGVVIDPMLLLALALIGLALGGLPARRLWIVGRLSEPSPDTSATARIEGWWRLVEIALCDAGVELRPGEAPDRLLERARPSLKVFHPLDVDGLAEAAIIRDRVAYGLGVNPEDLGRMERIAVACYETIWDRLGDRAQIRAMYRPGLADPGEGPVA